MTPGIQEVLALLIVAAALGAAVLRWRRARRAKGKAREVDIPADDIPRRQG